MKVEPLSSPPHWPSSSLQAHAAQGPTSIPPPRILSHSSPPPLQHTSTPTMEGRPDLEAVEEEAEVQLTHVTVEVDKGVGVVLVRPSSV